MPIRIEHTPVGALAGLAQQAGANLASQTSFMNSLRQRQLQDAAYARQRAQDLQFLQMSAQRQQAFHTQRMQTEQMQRGQTQFEREMEFKYTAMDRGEALKRDLAGMGAAQQARAFELQEATGVRQEQERQFRRELDWMKYETPEQKSARALELYGGKRDVWLESQKKQAAISTQKAKQLAVFNQRLATAKKQANEGQLRRVAKQMKKLRPDLDEEGTVLAGRATYYPVPKRPKTIPELQDATDMVKYLERETGRAQRVYDTYHTVYNPKYGDKTAERLGVELGRLQSELKTARETLTSARQTAFKQAKHYSPLVGGGPVSIGPVGQQNKPADVPVGKGQYPSPETVQAAINISPLASYKQLAATLRSWGYNPNAVKPTGR